MIGLPDSHTVPSQSPSSFFRSLILGLLAQLFALLLLLSLKLLLILLLSNSAPLGLRYSGRHSPFDLDFFIFFSQLIVHSELDSL